MRLVSWNCCGAFERKRDLLFDHEPCIAIVMECSADSLAHLPAGYRCIYLPSNRSKGVAIVYRNGYTLGEPEIGGEIIAAVDVSGDRRFRLVAVWPCASGLKTATYVHAIHRALERNPSWLQSPVILAGDFNSHGQWDKKSGPLNFTSLIEKFSSLGLTSLHHHQSGERHGHETLFTYSHQWKHASAFHIDYIFASKELLTGGYAFEIGDRKEYLAKEYSDHVPLILNLP